MTTPPPSSLLAAAEDEGHLPPLPLRLRSPWRELMGAAALVVAATGGTLALQIADIARTPLFLSAVVISSALAGARAGMLASLLAVVAIDLFILEEPLDLSLRAQRDLALLLIFVGASAMMTVAVQYVHWRRRDAERRAQVAEAEAELAQRDAEQLRAQLQRLRGGGDAGRPPR